MARYFNSLHFTVTYLKCYKDVYDDDDDDDELFLWYG